MAYRDGVNVTPPTKLVTLGIPDISEAGYMIGDTSYDGKGYRIAPLVLVPERSACGWWIVIPKGFTAIATKYGRYVGLWHPGIHSAPPWFTISHLISQQYCVYDTPIKECPTQDNVMVEIDITTVFHIVHNEKDLVEFAYKLGPEKLDAMLKAFQEEAVREMARKRKYNEIYDLMDTSADRQLEVTMRMMNDNLREYGVEIERITITNVHLPKDLADTMQEATTWESRNTYNAIQQDYDMLKIDNDEMQQKRKQQVDEERKASQAEYDKLVATSHASLKEVMAVTEKLVAEINEKETAGVLEIKSKAELGVAEIEAKKDIEISQITATGRAEVTKIETETSAYIKTIYAEAEKKCSEHRAQALEFKAEAEKIAAMRLKQKRDFEEKMKHLGALRDMANNKDIVVSGNNGDNTIAQLMSANRATIALGVDVHGHGGGGGRGAGR